MALKKNTKNGIIFSLAVMVFILLATYLNKYENRELENMQVVLTAQVPVDDTFQLFYWEESEAKFQIDKSVRAQVTGGDSLQEIIFELPPIKNLFRLRLDIGENKDQGPVRIKQIRFVKEYQDDVFGIQGFNRLFQPNKYIEVADQDTFNGISGGRGNGKQFYDPYFISVDTSPQMEQIRINRLTSYPYLIAGFVCLVLLLFAFFNIDRVTITQKGFFISLFVTMLLLPTVQSQFEIIEPLGNSENRKLAQKPEFEFSKEFSKNYEDFYSDNFGLRNHLTSIGSSFKVKLLNSSTHPNRVQIGKEKWLYYNHFKSKIFNSYSRNNLLPADSLELIVKYWEANKRRYNSEGRKYALAFWPNKHSIYPEYLPYTMKSQIRDTLSRVDQLVRYMEQNRSCVTLTDVRQELLLAKEEKQVYHKFDTHWNDYGAFIAYKFFFKENYETLGIEPLSEEDFNIVWNSYTGGDLIQMLGVRNNGYFLERRPVFTSKGNNDQIKYLPIKGYPRLTVITRNETAGNQLKTLVFRDSFTNGLIQFLSLHFKEVYYIWGHHEKYVDLIQPDIVIDAFVERELGEKIP